MSSQDDSGPDEPSERPDDVFSERAPMYMN
jgi:hypothetical protein